MGEDIMMENLEKSIVLKKQTNKKEEIAFEWVGKMQKY